MAPQRGFFQLLNLPEDLQQAILDRFNLTEKLAMRSTCSQLAATIGATVKSLRFCTQQVSRADVKRACKAFPAAIQLRLSAASRRGSTAGGAAATVTAADVLAVAAEHRLPLASLLLHTNKDTVLPCACDIAPFSATLTEFAHFDASYDKSLHSGSCNAVREDNVTEHAHEALLLASTSIPNLKRLSLSFSCFDSESLDLLRRLPTSLEQLSLTGTVLYSSRRDLFANYGAFFSSHPRLRTLALPMLTRVAAPPQHRLPPARTSSGMALLPSLPLGPAHDTPTAKDTSTLAETAQAAGGAGRQKRRISPAVGSRRHVTVCDESGEDDDDEEVFVAVVRRRVGDASSVLASPVRTRRPAASSSALRAARDANLPSNSSAPSLPPLLDEDDLDNDDTAAAAAEGSSSALRFPGGGSALQLPAALEHLTISTCRGNRPLLAALGSAPRLRSLHIAGLGGYSHWDGALMDREEDYEAVAAAKGLEVLHFVAEPSALGSAATAAALTFASSTASVAADDGAASTAATAAANLPGAPLAAMVTASALPMSVALTTAAATVALSTATTMPAFPAMVPLTDAHLPMPALAAPSHPNRSSDSSSSSGVATDGFVGPGTGNAGNLGSRASTTPRSILNFDLPGLLPAADTGTRPNRPEALIVPSQLPPAMELRVQRDGVPTTASSYSSSSGASVHAMDTAAVWQSSELVLVPALPSLPPNMLLPLPSVSVPVPPPQPAADLFGYTRPTMAAAAVPAGPALVGSPAPLLWHMDSSLLPLAPPLLPHPPASAGLHHAASVAAAAAATLEVPTGVVGAFADALPLPLPLQSQPLLPPTWAAAPQPPQTRLEVWLSHLCHLSVLKQLRVSKAPQPLSFGLRKPQPPPALPPRALSALLAAAPRQTHITFFNQCVTRTATAAAAHRGGSHNASAYGSGSDSNACNDALNGSYTDNMKAVGDGDDGGDSVVVLVSDLDVFGRGFSGGGGSGSGLDAGCCKHCAGGIVRDLHSRNSSWSVW